MFAQQFIVLFPKRFDVIRQLQLDKMHWLKLGVSDNSMPDYPVWVPDEIAAGYIEHGIRNLLPWQMEILNNRTLRAPKYANLVFSAPTSSGKTVVAELIAVYTVQQLQCKALFIFPYVSVAKEKFITLQKIWRRVDLRVSAFMGTHSSPPQAWDAAICTIEKANSLLNRMIDDKTMYEIGVLVIDEFHILFDGSRGPLVEQIVGKILYISRFLNHRIQIICLSATLPNLDELIEWLSAEKYETQFRPVELHELIMCGSQLQDAYTLKFVRTAAPSEFAVPNDIEHIIQLCVESVVNRESVLVFCSSKAETEKIALAISHYFEQCLASNANKKLISSLDILSLKAFEQAIRKELPFIDDVLLTTVPYGIAFHHAGLTMEEREAIECAFREQTLRVLCATSTLSSGVNLPAHRVIIKAQTTGPVALNSLTYMQMVGRAGRLGQTAKGESIVVCTKKQLDSVRQLIQQKAVFARRCAVKRRRIKLIIEAVCSGLCTDENDLENLQALLFFGSEVSLPKELIFLLTRKLISFQKGCCDGELRGTQLGQAVFASSLPPDVALQVYDDLEKAMRSLALDTELHLLYLVTPLHNDSIWMNYIDWNVYYKIWSKLPTVLQRVGKMVGVCDSFILGKMQGRQATEVSDLQIHLRFLSALALFELIRECPLSDVARRFHINRGALQTLQQQSATYAHMVVTFCERLGWTYLRSVLDGFAERLTFGVRKDLTELVQIEGIDGARARAFHSANVTTIATLAITSVNDIAKILRTAVPFVRRQNIEGLNRWLAGEGLMTDVQAAEHLIRRARLFLSSSLRALGIFSDAKIDSLFSAITSASEAEQEEENPDTTNSECDDSMDSSQNAAFELSSYDLFADETFPVISIAKNSHRGSSTESTQSEDQKQLPTQFLTNNMLNGALGLVEKRTPKIELSKSGDLDREKQPVSQYNPVEDKGNPEKQDLDDIEQLCLNFSNTSMTEEQEKGNSEIREKPDDVEQLCLNFSSTSMSDETLLRIGCSQYSSEITQITQALDAAAVLANNEKLSKVQKDKEEDVVDSKKLKSFELLNSVKNENSLPTTTATEKLGTQDDSVNQKSGILGPVVKQEPKDSESPRSSRMRGDDVFSFLGSALSQPTFLESIEEEKENKVVSDENSGNQSDINSSGDIFDRTYCSSSSHSLLGTPNNSSYCLKRIHRRSSVNQSPVSPSFRSPLHKMLKGESPLPASLNQGTILAEDAKGDETAEFQIVDVCGSRMVWEEFIAQNEFRNQIGVGIATCSKGVIGIAVCSLNEKCIYIDLRQNSISPIGIHERVAVLNSTLKSKQQKYVYDLLSFLRALRQLPGAERFTWQLKDCICLQTLSYLAHYRTADGEFALSFQDLVSQLTSPERAVFLKNATPRIRAAIGAFVCLHMHDDLMSAAVRLSSAKSVDLELKSVILFSQIEATGMAFDVQKAKTTVARINQTLSKIEMEAQRISGVPFNFNSAAEISQVLFVRLQIPPPNESTSRHYSTNKGVLKQLAPKYPIANLILEWRRMNIALTTSLPTLLKSCNSDSRIHPNFAAQSCTGRVLTVHPNVQNVQKDVIIDGCSVRSLFFAPKDKMLLSADYRQLEMRVLAHLSADPKLISMFLTEIDFFQTVTNTWNANESLRTKVDRNKVKQLCYGILYGMGAASLGKQLGLQKNQAQQMVSSFFQQFPKVRTWMDKTLETCRTEGSVSTLLGRRRFLPHITSILQAESAQAERQAINTCVQGSAAELFKMALLKLQKNLLGTNSSIIMQMHDEVLVEADESTVASVIEIMKHSMTTVMPDFRVPLAVKISSGRTWGELQECSF